MCPFEIAVILILTVLFFVLSIIPLLPGQPDMDSYHRSPGGNAKAAR